MYYFLSTFRDKPRKKLWQDTGKWLHDKFNEQDQAPKCEQELVAMYGYDIRTNERLPDGFKRKPRYVCFNLL